MQVYDSVYSTLDKATLDVIAKLFQSSVVRMVDCQKQVGGRDCGLYAIAYATAIAHRFDTSTFKFNQVAMRNHLIKCFEQGTMSVFPQ